MASMGLSNLDAKSVPVLASGHNPFSSLRSEGSSSYGAAPFRPEVDGEGATGRSARSGRSQHSASVGGASVGGGNQQSFFPMPASSFKSETAEVAKEAEKQDEASEVAEESAKSTKEGAPQSFFPMPASNMDFKSSSA